MSAISESPALIRAQILLLGAWVGLLLSLGAVVAPGLFAHMPRAQAADLAGYFFTLEARLSLALALLMLLMERGLQERGLVGTTQVMNGFMLGMLAVLFMTIVAEYVLHPLIQQARMDPAHRGFATLHASSSSLFLVKTVLLLVLTWRKIAARSGSVPA